ncbi:MAG TPA: DNA-3-methyladenine glycosylase, partial [Prolixibacteraceae bacterium]|nr:DNA-3-methyladenine glycosylase [Prolixibacteraceae bacterium]
MNSLRLGSKFFMGDAVDIAQKLIGKTLVRRFDNGNLLRLAITETEAYRGEEDLACHASKGRTLRTEVMYWQGGVVYVYLIYGIYWMLNFVTSEQDFPAAVLVRGLEGINGPGRVGKALQL